MCAQFHKIIFFVFDFACNTFLTVMATHFTMFPIDMHFSIFGNVFFLRDMYLAQETKNRVKHFISHYPMSYYPAVPPAALYGNSCYTLRESFSSLFYGQLLCVVVVLAGLLSS